MKNKKLLLSLFSIVIITMHLGCTVNAANISLSVDKQWVNNVASNYEYITKDSYDKNNGNIANNPNWTSISGGTRADGTRYSPTKLISGNKISVLSAWYGKTVYFRINGNSGIGTQITIPAYSDGLYPYKSTVKILNAYSSDAGGSFYQAYIENLTDNDGYLVGGQGNCNITVDKIQIELFNKNAISMITDAEGNYIYDLIAVGVYTNAEPDISGAAAWALQDYIAEGYGFLIGHDTMYGYGGVTNADYVPNKNSTVTPMYVNNSKTNGHWNLNWLMGVNKLYTEASPYEAASMVLNMGDYRDKSTLYGDFSGLSILRIKAIKLSCEQIKEKVYTLKLLTT